jgi:hypothetical protein
VLKPKSFVPIGSSELERQVPPPVLAAELFDRRAVAATVWGGAQSWNAWAH